MTIRIGRTDDGALWPEVQDATCDLALYPGRVAALLLKPGVIDHQPPAGVAEPLGHLSPQRVPHLIFKMRLEY